MTPVTPLKGNLVNENETPETVTETPSETPTTLSRKALILAGTVTGILIAGGFAFLKKNQTETDLEITEEVEVEIEVDTPDTDTDQN